MLLLFFINKIKNLRQFSEKKILNKRALNHVVWYTNHFSHWNTTKMNNWFLNSDFWKFLRPQLTQFSKFNIFLWVCWFVGKNFIILSPLFENSTTLIAILGKSRLKDWEIKIPFEIFCPLLPCGIVWCFDASYAF